MSTRGFVGFLVGGETKLAYNHSSSNPNWLGSAVLDELHELVQRPDVDLRGAAAALKDPTGETIRSVAATNPHLRARLAESSTGWTDSDLARDDDETWYRLLRYRNLTDLLQLGLYSDNSGFALDGGSCEWGYLVDLDRDNGPDRPAGVFEVYRGRQRSAPTAGRWKSRPTRREMDADHAAHLAWCAANGREPWLPRTPRYKAVAPVATWPLDELPTAAQMYSLDTHPRTD